MVRYGMVIDLKRCIGCDTCTLACRAVKATPRGILLNRVLKYESGKYPHSRLNFLPVMCMHCEEPECKKVRPTGATVRREDGIVTIDGDKCMGCKYCIVACPYGARYFLDQIRTYYSGYVTPFEEVGYRQHRLGTVQKCDFCLERIERGMQPACVSVCPADARFFGDLDDPNSEVSKLIKSRRGFVLNPELGTKPSVYYLPPEQVVVKF
jgi:molybdopterin-containing oxidoreductase family iron-sulfur binding subunit